jgi:SAM-dependent methyltransferase/pyruvate-formate lyase-activating enzyme
MPGDTPSEYFKFNLRSPKTLDIAFTHALEPAGSFDFGFLYDGSSKSVLYLNTTDMDYYQNGIPGVTRSIEETVSWIQAIKATFGFEVVRTIGQSMGGYAALVFGDLLEADMVLAISPVIGREYTLLGKSASFRDPSEAILRLKDKAIITFGAFEAIEYLFIAQCLAIGMELDDLWLVGNGHASAGSLDLSRFVTANGRVPGRELLLNPHPTPFGPDMISEIASVHHHIGARRDDRVVDILGRAAELDAMNPGFRYRRGVHLALLGRGDEAVADIREAMALNDYHINKVGSDILGMEADLKKKAVRDYGTLLGFAHLKTVVDVIEAAAQPPQSLPPGGDANAADTLPEPPAMDRTAHLLSSSGRDSRILEIGPCHAPVAPKAAGWRTSILDCLSRDEMVKKWSGLPVDTSRIEEVDYIWTSGNLHDAVPKESHGTFDTIIASHVVEHMPDLVGFFVSAIRLLKETGTIALAVPDKRYCFDYFRPHSTTGEVLGAIGTSRHTLKTVFDSGAYSVFNDGAAGWGQHPVASIHFANTWPDVERVLADYRAAPDGRYNDFHGWQFTPASFELLILELGHLGMIDWRIVRNTGSAGCEFIVLLRRRRERLGAEELQVRRKQLLTRILLELREQADFALAGDAGLAAACAAPLDSLRISPAQFQGYVGERSTVHVQGWVRELSDPTAPVEYEVVVIGPTAERVIHRGYADRYDGALARHLGSEGNHAFQLLFAEPLSEPDRDNLVVRPVATGRPLELSPWLQTEFEPIAHVPMDIVDNCNLRCPFCLYDYSETHTTNIMTDEVFDSVMRLLPYVRDGNFWLSCLHEPTLHPRFLEFIERVPTAFRRKLFFTTNLAKRMPRHYFEVLANAGIHTMNVSLESLRPELYEMMRKGARHQIFAKNWETMLDAFAGGTAPPGLRYIIMAYRSNLQEIPELVEILRREKMAKAVEVRDTFKMTHIAANFRRQEYLSTEEWAWLQGQLGHYQPHEVVLVLPPGGIGYDPATDTTPVGRMPAGPPAVSTPWPPMRRVVPLLELRVTFDGTVTIYSENAGGPGWGPARMNYLVTNILYMEDPLQLLKSLWPSAGQEDKVAHGSVIS